MGTPVLLRGVALQSCVLVLVCCALSSCGEYQHEHQDPFLSGIDDAELMRKGEARLVVAKYEKLHTEFPDNFSFSVNLAMLYGLSVRLDDTLNGEETARRKREAIALIKPTFDRLLGDADTDQDRLLYLAGILAQNYASIGEPAQSMSVFESVQLRIGDDERLQNKLTVARNRLADRIRSGYPFDMPNPFD